MAITILPTRREALGTLAAAGVSVSVPMRSSAAAPAIAPLKGRAKSVILVNLTGGLSHIDTLDMKPNAPAEFRGEFKQAPTAIVGVQICDLLPKLAARMKQWALVRSLAHRENSHLPGTHRLLTGNTMPNQRGTDLDNVLSRRDCPCYAAGLNALRPRTDGIPNGVSLPHMLIEGPLTWPGQHGGFLGASHDPMFVTQDPNSPKFRMGAFSLPTDSNPDRVADRQSLLDQLDHGRVGDANFPSHQRRAIELLTSNRVARAFELSTATDAVRDRYGRNQFGQSLLLANRLAAVGVPIIQANMGIVQSWDTHVDNWGRLKTKLLPWLDQGLAALMDDLHADGRIAETLVVVSGEFGRTPKISTLPEATKSGRDHWAHVYSGLFAGAGVVGGRVIGQSDSAGAYPTTMSYTPFDIGATIYHSLGVDPQHEIRDSQNRPTRICGGDPMHILFRG